VSILVLGFLIGALFLKACHLVQYPLGGIELNDRLTSRLPGLDILIKIKACEENYHRHIDDIQTIFRGYFFEHNTEIGRKINFSR
jgi:hypothetical protein